GPADSSALLPVCRGFPGATTRRRADAAVAVFWPGHTSVAGVLCGGSAGLNIFNSPTGSVARELMRFASYLCFYYAVIDWVRTDNDTKAVLQALMLSTIAVAIFGFCQYVVGDYTGLYEALYPVQDELLKNPPFIGRITSFLSHYNGLAAYLNMVVPFCIGFAVRARDRFSRLLGGGCFMFASLAILLTQSRGGL